MSAFGIAVSVTAVTAAAGVTVGATLGNTGSLTALATRADGTALAGVTTDLTLQTRASSTAPWVDVAELTGSLSTVGAPVAELRVFGVLDAADDPAVVQVFGRPI